MIDDKPGHRVVGVSIILSRGRPILVADTAISEMPTAADLAEIAIEAAGVARRLGYEPRVAMLAFSNFGHPPGERALRVQEAVRILDAKRVDFEYDGEMGADVALNRELMAAYPFCRLKDTANVLIMPAFHSAAISTRMLQELGGATVIGPLIVGLEKPVQIVSLGAKDFDIVNMAAMASFNIRRDDADRPSGTPNAFSQRRLSWSPLAETPFDMLHSTRSATWPARRTLSRPSFSSGDERRGVALSVGR